MPPFEERVVLEVRAEWTADKCVNVTTRTNLPKGTTAMMVVQNKYESGEITVTYPTDFIFHPEGRLSFVVQEPEQVHEKLFCGVHRDGRDLLLRFLVSNSMGNEQQAKLLGPKGEKLKGPSVHRTAISTKAGSKTFFLKPVD